MRQYEPWHNATEETILTSLPVSALNVLIFVIYEVFFMTALDKTIEIFRNFQMKRALKSGYFVTYATAFVWCGKQLETKSIKDEKEERGGLIGWIRFWFYRFGWLYTLLYAAPAVALIYAQLHIGSERTEAITGSKRGHLLHVDLENLLEMKEPDGRLEKLREKIDQSKRSLVNSRVIHHRVYEVDGKALAGKSCRPGLVVFNSTRFEVKYFDPTEKDKNDLESESTVSRTEIPVVTTSKHFTARCNKIDPKLCLAHEVKGPNLLVVSGKQAQDNNGLNTTKPNSRKYARIFLDRDWKKGEAETLIKFMLPIVNKHYDDNPIYIIDAVWLLSLRKTKVGRDKVVPEECELVMMTTLSLPSIIILGILLLVTIVLELLLVVRWLLKRRNDRTLLNESGTTKGLLWSYANELKDGSTGYNRAPEEMPKVCISTGSIERDHRGQELVDVRPAFCIRNNLEISENPQQTRAYE